MVDHTVKGSIAIPAGIFTNTVEHHDGVAHRITDDGQDGRQGGEREFLVGNSERPYGDDGVVQKGHDGAWAIAEIETNGDVDDDQHDGAQQSPDAVELEFLAGLGAH